MESTISVRIKSKAGANLIRGQYRHDLRKGSVPGYVDKTRSNQNTHISLASGYEEKPGDLIKEFKKRLRAKKTARTAEVLVGVVTFSKGAQNTVDGLSRADQNKLFQHIVERIAADMDVPANYVEVHRDETAVHAHFSLLNLTSNGCVYRGNRGDMSRLQDVAGNACKDLGYDIRRGKSKIARIRNNEDPSKWIHRGVKQLHEDLPQEIATLEAQRNVLAENIGAMSKRLDEAKKQTLAAEAQLNERIKELEGKRDDLAKRVSELEKQRDEIAKKIRVTSELLENAEEKLKASQEENLRLGKRVATYSSRLASQEGTLTELQEEIDKAHLTLRGITADFEKSIKLPPMPAGRKRLFGSPKEILIEKSALDQYVKAIEKQYLVMRKKELDLDGILRTGFVKQSHYDAVKAERDKFKDLLDESKTKLQSFDKLEDENKKLRERLSRYEVIEPDPAPIGFIRRKGRFCRDF